MKILKKVGYYLSIAIICILAGKIASLWIQKDFEQESPELRPVQYESEHTSKYWDTFFSTIEKQISETKFPVKGNELVTWTAMRLSREFLSISYEYELDKSKLKYYSFTPETLKEAIIKESCANPAQMDSMARGLTLKYVYTLSDGAKYLEFTIKQSDCVR